MVNSKPVRVTISVEMTETELMETELRKRWLVIHKNANNGVEEVSPVPHPSNILLGHGQRGGEIAAPAVVSYYDRRQYQPTSEGGNYTNSSPTERPFDLESSSDNKIRVRCRSQILRARQQRLPHSRGLFWPIYKSNLRGVPFQDYDATMADQGHYSFFDEAFFPECPPDPSLSSADHLYCTCACSADFDQDNATSLQDGFAMELDEFSSVQSMGGDNYHTAQTIGDSDGSAMETSIASDSNTNAGDGDFPIGSGSPDVAEAPMASGLDGQVNHQSNNHYSTHHSPTHLDSIHQRSIHHNICDASGAGDFRHQLRGGLDMYGSSPAGDANAVRDNTGLPNHSMTDNLPHLDAEVANPSGEHIDYSIGLNHPDVHAAFSNYGSAAKDQEESEDDDDLEDDSDEGDGDENEEAAPHGPAPIVSTDRCHETVSIQGAQARCSNLV
ncbi:hypothetical protein QBC45DRAFT_398219 [Copromyces sp. CBS 386.78]|nr:hypothetical protein QBC45DRAFT_398219 [Copromyces sp. CBS 386.78]